MRITNNMIMRNSISNINDTKTQTDKLNNQMTSQKKITKASDDPVIAIRSLRLRNSQSQINQYYNNNISDAESWLDNTETALTNMKSVINDAYVLCSDAVNGEKTTSDRNTLLTSLQSLRDDLYSEGNADYAGRTIFSGYKTNTTLTFLTDSNQSYSITEPLSYSDISKKNYYTSSTELPADLTGLSGDTALTTATETEHSRIRLAYDNLSADNVGMSITSGNTTYTLDTATGTFKDAGGNELTYATTDDDGNPIDKPYTFETQSYSDWEAAGFTVAEDAVIYVPETGELVLGSKTAQAMNSDKMSLSVTYDKTGFKKGEVRPEMYFTCTDKTDTANTISYTKQDQAINYTISSNTTLTVNTQASDVFGTEIGRDVDELVNALQAAVIAQNKVDQIDALKASSTYTDDEDAQAYLSNLLTEAQKELDYANENVENLFSEGVGNFKDYLDNTALAISDVGNKGERLSLVKTRMASQQASVKKLISSNEDKDLSEIVIEYTAAYNAYESALLAASKASSNTLLDYIS